MRIITYLLFVSLITGCIGTDFVDIPLGPQGAVADIEEDELSLLVGEEYPLTFRLLANDGSELNANWDWISQDVAVAGADITGRVIANGEGQTFIYGTAKPFDGTGDTFTDSVLVTVSNDPNSIASITIMGPDSSVAIGDIVQLEAVVRNFDGQVISAPVEWLSSNESVATIDDDGSLEALSAGSTTVTALSDGISSVPFAIEVSDGQSESRMGTFEGRNGYDAEGTAVLDESGDDRTLEFLADFRTQNGPGLYIYLSPNASNVTGAVNLGEIVATSGAQTYNIPSATQLDGLDHVIIYCKPFGVLFGVATLE